jgi:putative transposase
MQNGFVESFNGHLRDEWLNEHVFANLNEARQIIEEWRTGAKTRTESTYKRGNQVQVNYRYQLSDEIA